MRGTFLTTSQRKAELRASVSSRAEQREPAVVRARRRLKAALKDRDSARCGHSFSVSRRPLRRRSRSARRRRFRRFRNSSRPTRATPRSSRPFTRRTSTTRWTPTGRARPRGRTFDRGRRGSGARSSRFRQTRIIRRAFYDDKMGQDRAHRGGPRDKDRPRKRRRGPFHPPDSSASGPPSAFDEREEALVDGVGPRSSRNGSRRRRGARRGDSKTKIDAARRRSRLRAAARRYTVFAPTNRAFAALDAYVRTALLKNKRQLKNLVLNHVVGAATLTTELVDGDELESLARHALLVRVGSSMRVDDAEVVEFDELASNGVLDGLGDVLVPCPDDPAWAKKNQPEMKCEWVLEHGPRCDAKGENNIPAWSFSPRGRIVETGRGGRPRPCDADHSVETTSPRPSTRIIPRRRRRRGRDAGFSVEARDPQVRVPLRLRRGLRRLGRVAQGGRTVQVRARRLSKRLKRATRPGGRGQSPELIQYPCAGRANGSWRSLIRGAPSSERTPPPPRTPARPRAPAGPRDE